jgi:hypothetical protein
MDRVVISHPTLIDNYCIYAIIMDDTRYDRYTNTYQRKN